MGVKMIDIRKKLIIALILAFASGLAGCKTTANELPQNLGGLELSKVLGNEESTKTINRMHGKTLGVTYNTIAYYGGSFSKNILYVSVYENVEKAKTDLMDMAMKMAAGTKVFSPLTYVDMGGDVHFQTRGMGLEHYFYRVGEILIWWQVEPDKAKATYQDLLEFDFTAFKTRIAGLK